MGLSGPQAKQHWAEKKTKRLQVGFNVVSGATDTTDYQEIQVSKSIPTLKGITIAITGYITAMEFRDFWLHYNLCRFQ